MCPKKGTKQSESVAIASFLAMTRSRLFMSDYLDPRWIVAILNHLRNCCRGNPPVVAPIDRGRHGGTTPTNLSESFRIAVAVAINSQYLNNCKGDRPSNTTNIPRLATLKRVRFN
jgi:hypothetical protein